MAASSLGDNGNSDARGALDFKKLDDNDYMFYALGTNNGFAAFSTNSDAALAQYEEP